VTTADRRLRVAAHVHAREFAGELVILDMAGGRYFSLDDVGTRVWRGIERGQTPRAIVDDIVREYAAEPERALLDVMALADDLVGKGLLEADPAAILTSVTGVTGRSGG
jgi:hypothetical protein